MPRLCSTAASVGLRVACECRERQMGPMFNATTWLLAFFYLPIVLLVVVPIAIISGLAFYCLMTRIQQGLGNAVATVGGILAGIFICLLLTYVGFLMLAIIIGFRVSGAGW